MCVEGEDMLPGHGEKMDVDDKRLECLFLFRKFTREVSTQGLNVIGHH